MHSKSTLLLLLHLPSATVTSVPMGHQQLRSWSSLSILLPSTHCNNWPFQWAYNLPAAMPSASFLPHTSSPISATNIGPRLQLRCSTLWVPWAALTVTPLWPRRLHYTPRQSSKAPEVDPPFGAAMSQAHSSFSCLGNINSTTKLFVGANFALLERCPSLCRQFEESLPFALPPYHRHSTDPSLTKLC